MTRQSDVHRTLACLYADQGTNASFALLNSLLHGDK
jgi:hypothetical protein